MPQFPLKAPCVGLALLTSLTGCSFDKHVFESTVDLPTSVALVDPLRNKTLWQMDIPVEHKLVLDFDRPFEIEPIWSNQKPATQMTWRLYNVREVRPKYWKSMKLPGEPFVMRVSYRPSPEFPPEKVLVDATGTAAPAESAAHEHPAAAEHPTTAEHPAAEHPSTTEDEPLVVPAEEVPVESAVPDEAPQSQPADESEIPLPGLDDE